MSTADTHDISIIIPTLDEGEHVARTITTIGDCAGCEIIVADGGSADGTAEYALRGGARVLAAPAGRGSQLAAGARAATRGVLLFLHADTRLPGGWAEQVRRVLESGHIAGAFRLAVDGPGWKLRLVEWGANVRSRLRQMPYGDQAIFMTREAYEQAGGFHDIPAMEDFDFVRRLRRRGRIGLCSGAVLTSARRWKARGVWRTTLLNQWCIVAFLLGISPQRIARWRSGGGDSPAPHAQDHEAHLGHVVHGEADALPTEPAVLDTSVGHVIDPP